MNDVTYVMRQMSRAKPPPLLDVKHDTNLFVNGPPVIYLFSFLRTGTAFMVIVQFRGRLVRQYACVVDSLGLGITCVLYHCTKCTRHPDLVSSAFYAIPIFPHSNFEEFLMYLSPLIFNHNS